MQTFSVFAPQFGVKMTQHAQMTQIWLKIQIYQCNVYIYNESHSSTFNQRHEAAWKILKMIENASVHRSDSSLSIVKVDEVPRNALSGLCFFFQAQIKGGVAFKNGWAATWSLTIWFGACKPSKHLRFQCFTGWNFKNVTFQGHSEIETANSSRPPHPSTQAAIVLLAEITSVFCSTNGWPTQKTEEVKITTNG